MHDAPDVITVLFLAQPRPTRYYGSFPVNTVYLELSVSIVQYPPIEALAAPNKWLDPRVTNSPGWLLRGIPGTFKSFHRDQLLVTFILLDRTPCYCLDVMSFRSKEVEVRWRYRRVVRMHGIPH